MPHPTRTTARIRPWTRRGLQLGLLGGLGLAFLGGPETPDAAEPPDCQGEGECTFKKPVFMLIVDYSTSMNNPFGDPMDNVTRWEAATNSVKGLMNADNGFVSQTMLVGLMRFGHDPDPNNDGTTIPGDSSGIVDGQALDLLWWDEGNENTYVECNGDAVIDAVNATPAPMDGALVGIGTWTGGAIERSRQVMEQSLALHPADAPSLDNRRYIQLVMTDGEWTNPEGQGQSPAHNPANTAAAMFDDGVGTPGDETLVPTYVVYFGELGGSGETAADELAAAGGTVEALTADDQMSLFEAVVDVVQQIKDELIVPDCIGGLPRVMVLLDASSSMLNVAGGTMPAPKGESGWDQARFALAGDQSLFNHELLDENMMPIGQRVEDFAHLGLAVFGHNSPAPGEQRVLINYGPCMQDNFYWALSPEVSDPACPDIDYSPLLDEPAYPMAALIPEDLCDTPWGGSPINWQHPASVGGQPDPLADPDGPGFDLDTQSHMPRCDNPGGDTSICSGSGTYTHLGLELIKQNQAAYHAQALQDGEADESTRYLNILITDGKYDGYSTDAQVKAELEEMAAAGIETFVIGLGDGVNMAQLDAMAVWGGTGQAYDADNQAELEIALGSIVESIELDPCCAFNDCSENPEPGGFEEDEVFEWCLEDLDCGPDEVCSKGPDDAWGECVPVCGCSVDSDCGDLELCVDCECVPAPCVADSDCDQGAQPPEICVDNQCVPGPCDSDAQCPGALACVNGECEVPACPAVPCPDGETCVDGDCVLPSCPDVPCGVDEECQAGVCVPVDDSTGTSTSDGEPETTTTGDEPTTEGPEETGTDTGADTTGVEPGCDCAATPGQGPGTLGALLG
ncbi:MAG: VWA domain-containing protein, partial [Myxococcales bacterium]|nr:VWA domain-containing protein [Myxococcales bacterium]